MRKYDFFIKDILAAIKSIEKFIEEMDFSEFEKDDKTSSAVLRKLEIIGEAAKRIPEGLKKEYGSIPWRGISGLRDKLIHGYFTVDYKLVWEVVKKRIPEVKPLFEQILDEIEEV